MWNKVLRTSEFWIAFVTAICGLLAQFGLLDPVMQAKIAQWSEMAISYVAFRLVSKGAKAAVPAGAKAVPVIAVALGLSMVLAAPVAAEDVSLVHKDRVRLSIVAGGEWNADDPVPSLKNSVVVGPTLGYALTRHIQLVAPVQVGVPSGIVRTAPEARWVFDQGFAVGFGHEFYARGAGVRQWVASAIYAKPVWKSWSFAVKATTGLEQQELRTQVLIGHTFVHGKEH